MEIESEALGPDLGARNSAPEFPGVSGWGWSPSPSVLLQREPDDKYSRPVHADLEPREQGEAIGGRRGNRDAQD